MIEPASSGPPCSLSFLKDEDDDDDEEDENGDEVGTDDTDPPGEAE